MLPLMILTTGLLAGFWSLCIEPSLVQLTKKRCVLSPFPKAFSGLKVFHFSDIHFRKKPTKAHQKGLALAKKLKPDLILFTGDFLCHSKLPSKEALKAFLNEFEAPLGCFAILGNHDYETHASSFRPKAHKLIPHEELENLLKETPFRLLRNETLRLQKGDQAINLTGLGDLLAGDMDPEKAFASWDSQLPGLVLSHNPASFDHLAAFPGELILSGHTHGNQINLPFLRDFLPGPTDLRRGLIQRAGKTLFISRGLGAHLPLRFCSLPEVTLFSLEEPPCPAI